MCLIAKYHILLTLDPILSPLGFYCHGSGSKVKQRVGVANVSGDLVSVLSVGHCTVYPVFV